MYVCYVACVFYVIMCVMHDSLRHVCAIRLSAMLKHVRYVCMLSVCVENACLYGLRMFACTVCM